MSSTSPYQELQNSSADVFTPESSMEPEEKDLEKDGKTYPVFRKPFHVPSRWNCNPAFRTLLDFNNSTSSVTDAFKTIRQAFKDLGYLEDNAAMVHDYIHFMVEDILVSRKIPFMAETDIRNSVISTYFGVTPDIIMKGKKVIDFYSGSSVRTIDEKNSKYEEFKGLGFVFFVITPDKIGELEKTGLSTQDVLYLQQNYRIFLCEYQHWFSCMKLGRILFNDKHNFDVKSLEIPQEARTEFELLRQEWCKKMMDQVADQLRFRKDDTL